LALVHRDVAPPNILIGVDGDGRGVVKIADFGVARSTAGRKSGLLSSRDTQAGLKKGRASVLAPEQVTGGVVDHRADLWALGVTLWTMLVGAPPFSGAVDADLFDAILHAPVPRLAVARRAAGFDVDDRLGVIQTLLDELLARDAAARPSSAAAVAARLRDVAPAEHEDEDVAALVTSLGLPSLRA
jgi:serine/threonine-protein kinase